MNVIVLGRKLGTAEDWNYDIQRLQYTFFNFVSEIKELPVQENINLVIEWMTGTAFFADDDHNTVWDGKSSFKQLKTYDIIDILKNYEK